MRTAIKNQPRHSLIRPVYLLLTFLSIGYVYLLYRDALILNPGGHSRSIILLISISIALPEILIWAIAFISSLKLKLYSNSIKRSKDGKAMAFLADSLILMSAYIVLMSSSFSVTVLFKNTPDLNTAVTLENYIPLLVVFLSAVLLVLAARRLDDLITEKISKIELIGTFLAFLAVMGLFVWYFANSNTGTLTSYSIPRFVSSVNTLLYLYVLPQIFVWAMGLYACLEIAHFSLHVKGSIYKALLTNLYKGVLIVYICIFSAQVLILTNFNLAKFSLPLLLVYVLLFVCAFGFSLIYKGSSDLSRLEKV